MLSQVLLFSVSSFLWDYSGCVWLFIMNINEHNIIIRQWLSYDNF